MDNADNNAVTDDRPHIMTMTPKEFGEYLEHYGVKGMRWGVRKGSGEGKVSKEDRKWDKKLNKAGGAALVVTSAKSGPVIAKINAKPEYKNADFTKPSPLRDKYYSEHAKSFETMLNKELSNHTSTGSPSGKFKAEFKVDSPLGPPTLLVTQANTVSHSGMNQDGSFTLDVVVDDTGKIVRFDMEENYIAQGETFAGDFLKHHGVKGMRWGVRRSRKQLAKAAKYREKAEKAESKAGGKSDAGSKTKSSGKKKAKDMSDEELKTVLKRMEMEKKYNTLTAPKANPITAAGKNIVANATKGVMQSSLQAVGQSYATKYTAQYMANASKGPKLPPTQGPLRPPKYGGRS